MNFVESYSRRAMKRDAMRHAMEAIKAAASHHSGYRALARALMTRPI